MDVVAEVEEEAKWLALLQVAPAEVVDQYLMYLPENKVGHIQKAEQIKDEVWLLDELGLVKPEVIEDLHKAPGQHDRRDHVENNDTTHDLECAVFQQLINSFVYFLEPQLILGSLIHYSWLWMNKYYFENY